MKPLLELVMIVKNCENVIENTLLNIKNYIDFYTILDTGSTDNTINKIKDIMKDKKGNIYQDEFIDFSKSRNKVLDLAGIKCIYTIFLDDTYILKGGEELRNILNKYKKQKDIGFNIKIHNVNENKYYYSTRILPTESKFRYKYKVHEIPITKNKEININTSNIYIDDINIYETTQRSLVRYRDDLIKLKEDLNENPNDERLFYYIAQSNMILGNYKEAKEWYLKFIKLYTDNTSNKITNYKNEYLYQSYYNYAIILYYLKKGNNYWNKVEMALKQCSIIYPERSEPYYKIASEYYKNGKIKETYNIVKKLINNKITKEYMLEIDMDIYNNKIPYLYIETAIKLSSLSPGIISKEEMNIVGNMIDNLIKNNPDNYQYINIKELFYPTIPERIIKYNKKTVVFYTPFHKNEIWNPINPDTNIVSGSEIITINIAKELSNIGYKVFVFGNFKNKDLNYEKIYENIEYIDNSKYYDWLQKHYVNYLIVSREPSKMLYLTNIKNVYLWVHDIYPMTEYIQTHKTKFKGLLSLCNWHSLEISKEYNIPIEYIKKTKNAIYKERFENNNIEKKPYSFIWTSNSNRGLIYLLKIIPIIKEKYKETTLNIYVNKKYLGKEEIEIIEKNKNYIFLNERKSQQDIANEYLKNEIWLYPTDFKETYCINALEAQISKCLCVSMNIGSLTEIIGDRGILIDGNISDNKVQEKLLKELFNVLDNEEEKIKLIEKGYTWAKEQTFSNLVKEWNETILNV